MNEHKVERKKGNKGPFTYYVISLGGEGGLAFDDERGGGGFAIDDVITTRFRSLFFLPKVF